MVDVREIYADEMVGFSINKEATVAKLVVASKQPDDAGKIVDANRTILTMPVSAMQQLLATIQENVGQSSEGQTKN